MATATNTPTTEEATTATTDTARTTRQQTATAHSYNNGYNGIQPLRADNCQRKTTNSVVRCTNR